MGFLIDAVATWGWFFGVSVRKWRTIDQMSYTQDYLAEFNNHIAS
ncbi:hypothetical protein V473_14515 [Sphingobium cupriresistens LL01]|uniref:Uncharacterized protein n=1 Tax=Sphingobium cupriresistens LL01 TaxID=1420583 RepID=A0A0J7XJL1_9SPHN|nr:hypothetical protein V473_21880 [Sphingobium cupriresistens LL01]KMS54678.1 hypothetical protein V473_14580 [Sphingobium cupriresistens LL01]KMS55953.1 hypothetical protein V473_14515 [Sphingobium cupriresistens LL01]